MRNTSRFKEALIATGPLNGRWTIYDRALAGPQKHTTSPNILAILGNHPGASPQPRSNSHPITASSVIGFLSGIIFLVLAIFVSCLWLTWIWQPFGFYTLYFCTSAWFRTFLASWASESCTSSSRGDSIHDFQHCHSSTNWYDLWEEGLERLLIIRYGNIFQNWKKQSFETKLKVIVSIISKFISRLLYQ